MILSTACHTPRPPAPSPSSFYPIGLYGVHSTNDFATVRSAGFNLVVGQADATYLDAAHDAGLKVLAFPGAQAGPEFDAAHAERLVRRFDRHPALWAWYLSDEPEMLGVSPGELARVNRWMKAQGARKPTLMNVYYGYEALHYAGITDIIGVNRYPVPWLPLADLGHHLTMTRLAAGKHQPLVAILQAFDWTHHRKNLPDEPETRLRPPTYAEMRCMVYESLARGASGLLFYAWESSSWKLGQETETWEALKRVVAEVNQRRALFQAESQWWPRKHHFPDPSTRFNLALMSSVTSALLRIDSGSEGLPGGEYILTLNNTEKDFTYRFSLPPGYGANDALPVLGEARMVQPTNAWVSDHFGPYAVHIYGPP